MIIVSSISPVHSNADNQIHAIDSWRQYGECYSLNSPSEMETLRKIYGDMNIWFAETHRTLEYLFKKPLVSINEIIDFAIGEEEDLFIINSDIVIESLPTLHTDGITIFSRYDYTHHFGDGRIFAAGFDAFFIPKQFLKLFPPSIFAIGAAWHDYYYPYIAMHKEIPVYWPQEKHIYHKLHETQYSVDQWLHIGEIFRLYFTLPKHLTIPQIATEILGQIKMAAIKY